MWRLSSLPKISQSSMPTPTIVMIILVSLVSLPAASPYFLPNDTIKRVFPYDIAIPSLTHAKKSGITTNPEITYHTNPHASHPNFSPIISVTFPPPISRRQFHNLKKTYRTISPHSHSRVGYDRKRAMEGRGYDILDFLPPILQATWGCRFVPEDEYGVAPLHYQCYGFLLDVLWVGSRRGCDDDDDDRWNDGRRRRGAITAVGRWLRLDRLKRFVKGCIGRRRDVVDVSLPRLTIATPDSRSMYEALISKTELISDGFNATNGYGENDGIRPGDVILVFHDNSGAFVKNSVWLDHMAVYIDEGLLFEKSGSGEGTTFRMVDYDTFEKSWAPVPGLFRMEVRRPDARNPINVVRDLSLGGLFSLSRVREMAKRIVGDGAQVDIPGEADKLCGSYDEDTGKVLFTSIVPMNEKLELDVVSKRAKLPDSAFKPLLMS